MKQKTELLATKKKGEKEASYGVYFLCAVVLSYLIVFLFEPEKAQKCVKASGHILIHIFPVLIVIILLMVLMDCFVNPKTVSKCVGKGSGSRGWFLAVFAGMLSHGPIYVWYPLLRNLRNQGMKRGLIVVFLYNRAIKLPLLPLMVHYFGTPFVVILTGYMIIASFVEGHIVEMIEGRLTNQI